MTEEAAQAAVRTLLLYIGEDPDREGLKDTPRRVVAALEEMTQPEFDDPAEILKVQFDGDGYNEMIVCKCVDFVSLCEHHLMPFVGSATLAYIPRRRVVGLSKLGRIVDFYARRLQIQERMTNQIADALMKHLKPQGAGVYLEAHHSCMACRGARKQHSTMATTALRGCFHQLKVKSEFLHHIKA